MTRLSIENYDLIMRLVIEATVVKKRRRRRCGLAYQAKVRCSLTVTETEGETWQSESRT